MQRKTRQKFERMVDAIDGLELVEIQEHRGHPKLILRANGRLHKLAVHSTPRCYRADLNARASLRRIARGENP